MAQEYYLIQNAQQAQAAWNELKNDSWKQTTIAVHQDVANLDQYFTIIRMAAQYQIQTFRLFLNEDQTILLNLSTGLGGGMTLDVSIRIESLIYEKGMHMVVLSYSENMGSSSGSLFGGLLGGIAKAAVGNGVVEQLLKEMSGVTVSGNRITVDLDAFPPFRQVCTWDHFGRNLGDDLIIRYLGIQDHTIRAEFSWRF